MNFNYNKFINSVVWVFHILTDFLPICPINYWERNIEISTMDLYTFPFISVSYCSGILILSYVHSINPTGLLNLSGEFNWPYLFSCNFLFSLEMFTFLMSLMANVNKALQHFLPLRFAWYIFYAFAFSLYVSFNLKYTANGLHTYYFYILAPRYY